MRDRVAAVSPTPRRPERICSLVHALGKQHLSITIVVILAKSTVGKWQQRRFSGNREKKGTRWEHCSHPNTRRKGGNNTLKKKGYIALTASDEECNDGKKKTGSGENVELCGCPYTSKKKKKKKKKKKIEK